MRKAEAPECSLAGRRRDVASGSLAKRKLPEAEALSLRHDNKGSRVDAAGSWPQAQVLLRRYRSMIRWCCYCQKFMGEAAPFDDFSWTDGICLPCLQEGRQKTKSFSPEFEAKLQFFRNLRQKAVTGEHLSPAEILKQARQLGAGPSDIMMGVLQPILCELGDLFAKGKISTIEEHRFSAFTDKVLAQLENEFASKEPGQSRVIFASADQNYHTIGHCRPA
jgi:hypothetical protein